MAKNNKISCLLFFLGVLILSSCDNSKLNKENYSVIDITNDFQEKSQFFKFSSDSNITITGAKGTIIRIPRQCFVDESGSQPTSEINFELKECYSVSDIIFSNLSTQTSDKNLLETGGMVYIDATSNGKPLKLKEKSNLEIGFPKNPQKTKNMKLFLGEKEQEFVTWNKIIGDSSKSVIITDTIFTEGGSMPVYQKQLDHYLFDSYEMGWINCDRMLEDEDRTVYALSIDTNEVIPSVRMIFKNIRAAAYPILENGKLTFYNIPLNEPATLIGFYKTDDNKYYLFQKEIVVHNNVVDEAVFSESTLDNLKKAVESITWQENI